MSLQKNKAVNIALMLVIFSLTGLTSVFVSGVIMEELNLKKWSIGYVLGIIFIITPVYQVLLLFYAALFGKLNYFLQSQLKLLKLIRNFLNRKNQDL